MKSKINALIRLPVLPLVIVPFILMAPVLFSAKAIFWGTPLLQFAPWWDQAWTTLQSGQLPLWNPLNGMGAPLLANHQSALLYPPTWIYFILAAVGGTPALAWGMALSVAFHLAWSGLGMAALVRRLGWGVPAQTASGLAFGLCGYLVARSHFLSINAAAAWLPWILAAVYDLSRSPANRRQAVKVALLVALQLLAGHAQTAWYTLLLAAAWAGFWGWQAGRRAGLLRAWAAFSIASASAVALAAVQLLPTAEYLAQSQRATAVDFTYALNYSFWPWHFLNLVTPNIFGSPAAGDYWAFGAYWEDAIYIGILPLLLALAALFRRGKPSLYSRLVWFLSILLVVTFLFALGSNTPIYPWLYRHIPTFDMFQAPARYTIWAEFALALLAGLGFEGWRRPEKRALYWSRLGAAAAFAVTLGAGLGWYLLATGELSFGQVQPTFIPAIALAGLWGLGTGILNLLAPPQDDPQPRPTWVWAAVILLSLDLLVSHWGLNPGVGLHVYGSNVPLPAEVAALQDGQRIYLPAAEEEEIKFDRFLIFEDFGLTEDWANMRSVMLPDANLFDGIASANNFDPLVPGRYAHWMDTLQSAFPHVQEAMLARMAVGLLQTNAPGQPYGISLAPTASPGRLRWVPCAEFVSDGQAALHAVTQGGFDVYHTVVLEAPSSTPPPTPCPPAEAAKLLVTLDTPNRITVLVGAAAPGYLVLADVWYPGWRAYVNGQAQPVLRADYLFRAIQLPAGASQVEFVYRPTSFYAGAALTALALFALLWLWRRSKDQDVQ
ncbi:MAG: YfhO family protein [Anaerolineae bacterium]|nr:YfhO family protein [Anaerolineae bacterium]